MTRALNRILIIPLLLSAYGCDSRSQPQRELTRPAAEVKAVIPSAIDAAAPGAAQAVSAEDIKQAQEAAADSPQHE
ncbi:MAG TPA: hypothetical protein PKD17_18125 [Cellvibrionaceae bacterium]|nr:hypothetical protein [Cellvibrionaceae bacterium]HNG58202.1 hypothetical protein [Cellvibrionaceae bacterium]